MVTRYEEKAVPQGGWDTHCHVFDSRFPLAVDRHFTPSVATLEQLHKFHSSLGISSVCFSHGLSYGPDCQSLLYCLGAYHGTARASCVLDLGTTTDALLDEYHRSGVRSVRLNLFQCGVLDDIDRQVSLIRSTATLITDWSRNRPDFPLWSIQIQQSRPQHWQALRRIAAELETPLVVDHIGLHRGPSMQQDASAADRDLAAQGFADPLAAVGDGNVWVKLSAPYQCSDLHHTYHDLEATVRKLVKMNPDRVIWGSDWPHTQRHHRRVGKDPLSPEEFQVIDNHEWIRTLSTWMSEDDWTRMWVTNPRKLYGLDAALT